MLKREGFSEMVVKAMGLESSEKGGRGRGRADSDHSAMVGVGLVSMFQRL